MYQSMREFNSPSRTKKAPVPTGAFPSSQRVRAR